MYYHLILLVFAVYFSGVVSFKGSIGRTFISKRASIAKLNLSPISPIDIMSVSVPNILRGTMSLADTSVSEEDIIGVVGQSAELPSPIFALVFAFFVFAGVAALQFSLGDLTKEEGQARVRDFLQTKRDTERKRGYFD